MSRDGAIASRQFLVNREALRLVHHHSIDCLVRVVVSIAEVSVHRFVTDVAAYLRTTLTATG